MNETMSEAAKKRIFQDRARALAEEFQGEADGRQRIDVVEIKLAHERYAVESLYVREVLPLKDVTPLPGTPAFVRGLLNVRGQILSVIDLRVLFDLPCELTTMATKVIILRSDDMEVGVVADAVVEAHSIPLDEIHSALPTMTGIRGRHLRGIVGGDMVILDAAKLLADKALVVNEEVEGDER